jgi:type II secretory pathway pseudopilin PulG
MLPKPMTMTKARIVVIASVAAALVAVAGWAMVDLREEYRKVDRVRIQLEMIAGALQRYAARHGRFPNTEEGLSALAASGEIRESAFIDPWGQPINYKCRQLECKTVVVTSRGDTTSGAAEKGELSVVVERK